MHIESDSRTSASVEFATFESSSDKMILILSTQASKLTSSSATWLFFFNNTRIVVKNTISSNLMVGLNCHAARSPAHWRMTWPQSISQFEIHSSSSEQYVWVFIEFFSSIKNYFDIHWHEIIAILSLTNQQTVASRVRRTLVFIKSDAINRVVNDDLICMRIFFSRRSSRCDVNTSLLSDLDLPDMFDQRMHETKMSRCATVSESQHRDAFDTWIKSNELRRTRVRCDNSVVRSDDLA